MWPPTWMTDSRETRSAQINITAGRRTAPGRERTPKPSAKGHFRAPASAGGAEGPTLETAIREFNCQLPNWSKAGGNPKIAWPWNMIFVFIFDALGIQTT